MKEGIIEALIKGGFDTANNLINGQIQKNLQSKNHEHQMILQKQSLEIQDLHHKEKIIADAYEQKANRENQFSIAKLNVLSSHFRDELNRDFQERMRLLDIEEKSLDREQLFQLEEFKAELQIWMQKKQRIIQLEIKRQEAKLAKELAEYNRQTQLNLIREGKRISQLPTWIDLHGILGRKNNSGVSTIHIFFSPPHLDKETDSDSAFPKISRSIEKKLEEFINLFRDWDIPVNFVSGAWESKKYYGKAAVESFFSELQSEPTIILQNNIEGTNFFIDLASWVDNAKEPNYNNLLSFSWPNLLEKLSDTQEINKGDFLTKYLSIINYVFVGLRIDEYCLIEANSESRRKPLMPNFLPRLLADFPNEDKHFIIGLVSEAYKMIYERIGMIESAWIPEIKLQFADVLLQLEMISLAEGEVSISLNQFLKRNLIQCASVSVEEATSKIPLIINESDRNYINELYKLLLKFPQNKNNVLKNLEDFMKNQNRIAVQLLSKTELKSKGFPSIYTLEKMKNENSEILLERTFTRPNGFESKHIIERCFIGKPNIDIVNEKVVLLVGATGAGKTTLINGMINHIFDVVWEDDFRYEFILSKDDSKTQAKHQTTNITAYTIYSGEFSHLPFNLTIIDTLGFGDEDGITKDQFITSLIKDLFDMNNGIKHIDCVGFVTQSSLARLTPSQQYVFDAILSIFGKDIDTNIFLMITFATINDPAVLSAIKAAEIPFRGYYTFENGALFIKKSENPRQLSRQNLFWEDGVESFNNFFSELQRTEAKSLKLTKDVLEERKQLETTILGLRPRIDEGLSKMEELRQVDIIIQQREKEIEQNKNFEYKVERESFRSVNAPNGIYNTTCMQCRKSPCHNNCAYIHDEDKHKCSAMNNEGYCNICGCHWSKHKNSPYIYEQFTESVTETSEKLFQKYNIAIEEKDKAQKLKKHIAKEFEDLATEVFLMTIRIQQSLTRLDDIALKPNPLTSVEYLDLLIEDEKNNKKNGYKERIAIYKEYKKQAELMFGIRDNKNIDINEMMTKAKNINSDEKQKEFGKVFKGLLEKVQSGIGNLFK